MASERDLWRINRTPIATLAVTYTPDNSIVIHNGIIVEFKKEPNGLASDQAHNK